jgi:hypothetical protein
MDGKYQVYSHLGKGMFANVVRARVIQGEDAGKEVAIKIVRCQESMFVQLDIRTISHPDIPISVGIALG